ncbi:hypothetical protein, partial [Haliscomenobacter sp.]|uniref:hypothetical protein n=1 Tax=Haliscomenobacter sp. TaxID=2717303 RepID=UPI003593B2F9
MKLPFEEWVSQKHFSQNIVKLFSEAIISYKHSAYMASLLFSYLAFLTILKELIIKSTKAASIPQGRWDILIKKLQNDDTWEKCVFEELINNSSPIFNISDDIRQQVKYWKDRRNDCAHFKANDIQAHHTESFWSFIRSNLFKITLEGGKASLINKFRTHFDPTFTPPTADVNTLILEIEESVDFLDLTDFWDELINTISPYALAFSYYDQNIGKILNSVFELCANPIKENLAKFLKNNRYDLVLISFHPDKVNFMNYSQGEVRAIWRSRMSSDAASTLLAALLRNSLIPKDEISEANKYVINLITGHRPNDEITHLALAGNGFGDALFSIAIQEKRLENFKWVNSKADLIAYLIEKSYYWTFLQKGFLCGFNKLKTCLKNSRREKHFLVKTLNPSLKIETSRV